MTNKNEFMHEFLKAGDFYQIMWRDSRMYLQQCHSEDDFKICTISSVGAIVSADKEKIVLAGDELDEDVRRVLVIPVENVGAAHKLIYEKPGPTPSVGELGISSNPTQ